MKQNTYIQDLSKGKGRGKVRYVLYHYREKGKCSIVGYISRLYFTLMEYISTLMLCIEYLRDDHQIWGIVTIVIYIYEDLFQTCTLRTV